MGRFSRIVILLLLATASAIARAADGDAVEAGNADPQIVWALKQVSAKRIQASIEKLVSFQTRLTLSAQDPESIAAGHGIGAAREWIRSEGATPGIAADAWRSRPTPSPSRRPRGFRSPRF
jgi:hypothetical protein